MIKVLIIDDERLVREGLIHNIDWKSLDSVVVGEASNGLEGLEAITKYNPDLIITDIRMPKLDGIKMVKNLREKGLEIFVIFLTAYNDFSYAQKAIKLLASDYVLKPFEDGELEESVLRIKNKILEKKKSTDRMEINIKEGKKSKYINDAIEYIGRNYFNSDLSVEIIAEELGISSGHLSRTFKKETDYTILSFITQYRIKKAKSLLSKHKYKVYEVADLVGYKDITYFSSIFKKITGVSPSDYYIDEEE